MEATNTKLNSNSETYKTIFIYQSMSGDAEVGTSSFTSKNSKIIPSYTGRLDVNIRASGVFFLIKSLYL